MFLHRDSLTHATCTVVLGLVAYTANLLNAWAAGISARQLEREAIGSRIYDDNAAC